MFQQFGEIINAIVLKESDNNTSKGFGFVCFKEPRCAEQAYINLKDKQIFDGLPPLYVNYAMKKQERKDQLRKEKSEMFKNYQKLTVYVKVKNESEIVIIYSYDDRVTKTPLGMRLSSL